MHRPTTEDSSRALAATVVRLSTAETLESVTEIVTGAVRALTGADGASFVLREDDRCFYVDEDAISPIWKGLRFPIEACVSGWAMLHREVVAIHDIRLDPRVPQDAYRPTFVRSLLLAPIRSTDPIGALGAYWSEVSTPTSEQVQLMEVLANSASVALENLELRAAVARRSAERDSAAARTDELESAIHSLVHDLRSPLGAMLGYAELLQDGAQVDADQGQAFARSISSSGRRLSDQIDRMLELYRVAHRALEPVELDLGAMAAAVVAEHRVAEPGREVEVEVEEGLRVVADPVLVGVLLANLVDNAFKYTAHTPGARIVVGRADDLRPCSTFYVRDNGAGFDPAGAGRLFHPMVRLHHESEYAGTGLGLASVARVVELHGGSVSAQGEPDGGATISFSLPVPASAPPASRSVPGPVGPATARSPR